MRRVAVTFAVAACWVMCFVAPAWAQSPSEGDRYDCKDFKYQEDAQKVFDRHPGDPYGLDGPIGLASEGKPGVACEDLPHRPTSAGDQYAPDDTDNPSDVVPGSNSGGPLPNTGGPPYLVGGTVLLLGAAVVSGRDVLRQ